MFDIVTIGKYLSLLCYLGFFISSISGFVEISHTFNLCELLISIIIAVNIPIIIFIEIINKNKHDIKLIHYLRSYALIIMSLLVMGLSHIGLGFSILGLIICIFNLFLGIFDCKYETENIQEPVLSNN